MYFSEPPVAFPSSRSFRRSTSWQPRSSASQRWAATSILNLHGAVLHLPAPANGKKRPLTKESITHFHPFEAAFGQEGGDLDTFTTTGWDPACATITSRSRVPRNGQINTHVPLQPSQFLKTIDFGRTPPFTGQEVVSGHTSPSV